MCHSIVEKRFQNKRVSWIGVPTEQWIRFEGRGGHRQMILPWDRVFHFAIAFEQVQLIHLSSVVWGWYESMVLLCAAFSVLKSIEKLETSGWERENDVTGRETVSKFPSSKLFSTEVRELFWLCPCFSGRFKCHLDLRSRFWFQKMLQMNLIIFDSFQKILILIDPKWQGYLPPSSLFRCRRSFALILTFHDAMNGPTVAKKREIFPLPISQT